MKKVLTLMLALLGVVMAPQAAMFERAEMIYKKGEHTWVKITAGNKKLAPFDHPHPISREQLDAYLGSLRYYRDRPESLGLPDSEYDLWTAAERSVLVGHLAAALAQAGPDEWVDFSLGVFRGKMMIGTFRRSSGVLFVKDGELQIAFREIAERVRLDEPKPTADPTRSYGSKVGLQPAAGAHLAEMPTRKGEPEERINWLAMSLAQVPAAPPLAVEPEEPGAGSGTAPAVVAPTAAPAGPPRPARERLQELKQLYDEGFISQEEYQAKRQRILDEL